MRRFIRTDVIKTNVHPYRHCHCEERKARRGNLPEGKTDVTYTDFILLSWGISPLRSDYRPHSGRNDIIKQGRAVRNGFATFNQNDSINQTNTLSFRAKSRNPPATETARRVSALAHLPAVAHRREIPCGRNENHRTRLPQTLARRGSLPR